MSENNRADPTNVGVDLLPEDCAGGVPSLDELAFTLGVAPGDPAVEDQRAEGERS